MQASRLTITNEQKQALVLSGGSPIQLVDPETLQVYLLVEQPANSELDDDYIRAALKVGLDELESGQAEEWEIESIVAEAQRELAEGR